MAYKGPILDLDHNQIEIADDENNLQIPEKASPKVEKIMSSRIAKRTRHQTYWEHLVKW